MVLHNNSLSSLPVQTFYEVKKSVIRILDLNYDTFYTEDLPQMPIFQINYFIKQASNKKFHIQILLKNNDIFSGTVVTKSNNGTFSLKTSNKFYKILNSTNVKYIKLLN